jgi:hypothetical protein
MEKRCKVCGLSKSLSEFYRSPGVRDGHRNDCKSCNLSAKAERYRKDPDAAIARTRAWQRDNPERLNAYRRRRRQEPAIQKRERAGHLRRTFGMSLEDYDELLAAQDGRCAVCGRTPRAGAKLHVDHDHVTGAVRGLLCFSCNASLGHLAEDATRIQRLSRYLDGHDLEMVEMASLVRDRLQSLTG